MDERQPAEAGGSAAGDEGREGDRHYEGLGAGRGARRRQLAGRQRLAGLHLRAAQSLQQSSDREVSQCHRDARLPFSAGPRGIPPSGVLLIKRTINRIGIDDVLLLLLLLLLVIGVLKFSPCVPHVPFPVRL